MKFSVLAPFLVLLAKPTIAQSVHSITELIRNQTNVSSEAGQRGDQATVDHMTDDAVMFSSGDGAVQRDVKFDAREPELSELQKLTEACHGSSAGLRSCAAPSALFIDQTGRLNSRSDAARATSDKSSGVEDFMAHHTADGAVTSFTVRTQTAKLLVVEIWTQQGAQWHLLGGQAIPLYQDPPAIQLQPEILTGYAGTYTAGPGSIAVVSADGDSLAVSTDGGKPAKLATMARDVFFTPAQPAGYLRPFTRFERNASGQISGYLRNGIRFQRIDPAAATAPIVAVSPGPLVLRDFTVHRTGDIAIAIFFHDRDTPYHGQVLHQTFRSMEAWINRGGAWKMISSQGRQL